MINWEIVTFGDFILTVWVVVTLLMVTVWFFDVIKHRRYLKLLQIAESERENEVEQSSEVDMTNVVEFKRKDSNE
ncbi:hypothetical protein SL034_004236 [Vibrio harveyi]|nr:hypothetical protein [Vibrio harveyi]